MPFNDWFDEIIGRLNGMGYEEAPSPDGDPRWRWLLREEPLLRRLFILADAGMELEELRDSIKIAISKWRKSEHPLRIGILAAGHVRELPLLSEIPWVGAIWSLQEKGVRQLYQDGRWEVESNILRRRMSFNSVQHEEILVKDKIPTPFRPFLCYFFLAVYVVVFIVATLMGGSDEPKIMLALGAKDATRIWLKEYWRLITPLFFHIGFIHLFFNAFALFFLGPVVERLIGRWRFLVIYLVSGVFGVLAAVIGSPYVITASASAATFGLAGAWLLILARRPKSAMADLNRAFIPMYLVVLVVGFFNKGIGYYGHLAGFISGVALAGALGLDRNDGFDRKKPWLIGTGIGLITLLIVALYPPSSGWHIPFDRGRTALYEKDLDLAVDQLGLSLQRNKKNPTARYDLALAYLYRGEVRLYQNDDEAGALEDFRAGAALKESWRFHDNMAKIYYRMERPEDALMELERASELNPGNEKIKQDMEDLKRQMH